MSRKNNHTPFQRPQSPEFEDENPNSLNALGNDITQGTQNSFMDIGRSIFDQFMGKNESEGSNAESSPESFEQIQHELSERAHKPRSRGERITLFSLQERQERQQIQEIRALLKQIKDEITAMRRDNAMMMSEVSDIEKLTFETDPKAGVYHIRFLELIVKLLQSIRAKINESRTWMQQTQTRKAKRGSLFAKRSKEQGTQYSMSQELQTARSGQ